MNGVTDLKIGYIRVSTEDQNTARQEVLLQELGVDELFIDKASGKSTDRSELTRMMNYVRHGDTVIVESISRFARNTRDLLDLIERLTEKQVEFVSRKGGHRHNYAHWQSLCSLCSQRSAMHKIKFYRRSGKNGGNGGKYAIPTIYSLNTWSERKNSGGKSLSALFRSLS